MWVENHALFSWKVVANVVIVNFLMIYLPLSVDFGKKEIVLKVIFVHFFIVTMRK